MTSRPACASGSAATPPAAPSPMMTTSVFLSSVAMRTAFMTERGTRGTLAREHPVVVRGHMGRRWPAIQLLLITGHGQAHARVANEIPAGEIRVAAVVRIAKRSLDRVRENEVEER